MRAIVLPVVLPVVLAVVFGLAMPASPAGAAAPAPVVATTAGPVQGVEQDSADAYLGIPYAAPPVDDWRWRAPEPPRRWKSVRNANAFGANCPQRRFGPRVPPIPASEDCLFLNVWAPKALGAKKAPVMVWIHGGSYVVGSGDLDDSAAFTRDGVVLVSINYRLGRLGFFAHPSLTAERPSGPLGNYGVLDQIAALKWVRANIAKFGGDPTNVTIFGNSAGATFVDFLMVSPRSKGLFARAIAQSDPFALPWPYMAAMRRPGSETAEVLGDRWATGRGLAKATAAQLRAVPYDQTLSDIAKGIAEGLGPIIDGKILPERGPEAFAAGLAKPVPYIIGGNSYEGILAGLYRVPPEARIAELGSQGQAILDLYPPNIRNNPDLLGATIMGDGGFLAPRRWAARLAAKNGTPTWVYHFAYVPEKLRGSMPGAGHGMENRFVFADLKSPRMNSSAADDAMATTMHAYWVNFARTGNPNGPGLPAWPRFAAGTETLLSFNNDGLHTIDGFNDKLYDLYDQRLTAQRAGR